MMLYLCVAQALVVMRVLVCGVLMIAMVPEVRYRGLGLVFCDWPDRSGGFWSAVLSLLITVPRRRVDLLYGVVVVVFGDFGALWNPPGL